MMLAKHCLVILLIIVVNNYRNSVLSSSQHDEMKPLILTNYLRLNKTEEARSLSKVHYDKFQEVVSYSGYFTVNEKYDSNLFFWFFPSENNYLNDPVLLWLQGGPTLPGVYGLFEEHGPFIVKGDTVSLREYRWSKNHSVLYVDSPVGTGFSFTNEGYATNQTQVGEDLHEALVQFFKLFKEIKNNDFFLVGESYGGKYVPALGHIIHKKNPTSEVFINLKGLLINNGFVDPINQMDFGEYVYQVGLVDSLVKEKLDKYRDEVIQGINNKNFRGAIPTRFAILNLIRQHSGIVSLYNYKVVNDETTYYNYAGDWALFVNKTEVRKAIHVGNTKFCDNAEKTYWNLLLDHLVSVAPWLSELLDHYPVLLFNGQLDIIVPYTTTINFIKKLNYSGVEEYKKGVRFQWKVDREVAGYCKRGGLLYECLVRNAGHVVPQDQPKYAFSLVYNFVRNITFFTDNELF